MADGLGLFRHWQCDGTWSVEQADAAGLGSRPGPVPEGFTTKMHLDSPQFTAVLTRRTHPAPAAPACGSGIRYTIPESASVAVLDKGGYEVVRSDATRNRHEVTTRPAATTSPAASVGRPPPLRTANQDEQLPQARLVCPDTARTYDRPPRADERPLLTITS